MTTYEYSDYLNNMVETFKVKIPRAIITVQIGEHDGGWIYGLTIVTSNSAYVTRLSEEMILFKTRQGALNSAIAEINQVAGEYFAKTLAEEMAEILSGPLQQDLFAMGGV